MHTCSGLHLSVSSRGTIRARRAIDCPAQPCEQERLAAALAWAAEADAARRRPVTAGRLPEINALLLVRQTVVQ